MAQRVLATIITAMNCCLAGGTELIRYDARVAKCVADEWIDSSKVMRVNR